MSPSSKLPMIRVYPHLIAEVRRLAREEDRHLSYMANQLIEEALRARLLNNGGAT